MARCSRPSWGSALLLLLGLSGLFAAQGFYLPGVAPQDFKKKDVMFLKVNKLSSIKNQLPYEYYSLPYCRPERIVQSAENLGEVLRGDRIENSLYQVRGESREGGCCSSWEGIVLTLGASVLADPNAGGRAVQGALPH